MGIFLSTFINKIDAKGRVSVPSSFRTCLTALQPHLPHDQPSPAMVVFRSLKYPALEGCGIGRMQQLSASIDQLDLFSDAQNDLVSTIFADSCLLSFDKEGRVSIPETFLQYAGLTGQVAFVGRGATFQIWHPATFYALQEEARARLKKEAPAIRLVGGEKSL